MNLRSVLLAILLPLTLLSAAPTIAAEKILSILDYGAVPDGKTLCTPAIQKAIDAAAREPGTVVRFPAGTFLSGSLKMASGVTLQLDEGATLLGSRNLDDYLQKPDPNAPLNPADKPRIRNLIDGRGLHDIALRGKGTIDGSGDAFRDKTKPRPRNLYFEDCKNIVIEDIRLKSAGSWMQHYRLCEKVTIRNIDVFNHASFNNDGLDIDSCTDVTIANCSIDSDDDAIVLKSLSAKPCRNVIIRDCAVSSHCNALKLGTESGGGFIDITFANCTVTSPAKSKVIYGNQRGLAGIALEIVDGGKLENISATDIKITGVLAPLFLRLGDRGRPYVQEKPPVGTFKKVLLKNITADKCSKLGCAIAGLPDHPIEDVTLENISITFDGGGTREEAGRKIDERPAAYPECKMFGTLPAWGFYCRHTKNLNFINVKLSTTTPDARPAYWLEDAQTTFKGCHPTPPLAQQP